MTDWKDDYEINPTGVEPSNYSNQDDFMDSLRNNEARLADNASGKTKQEGCYIATCVYGFYDAPQVLTLRRFRDGTLKNRFLGRAFIKAYYIISPKLVKSYGNSSKFRRFFKIILDRVVEQLECKSNV